MPHHSSLDFGTIFDPDLGEGVEATVSPLAGGSYSVNVIVHKNINEIDDLNNVVDRVTVIDVITDSLAVTWVRGDQVTAGGEVYIVEKLLEEKTYVSKYLVS